MGSVACVPSILLQSTENIRTTPMLSICFETCSAYEMQIKRRTSKSLNLASGAQTYLSKTYVPFTRRSRGLHRTRRNGDPYGKIIVPDPETLRLMRSGSDDFEQHSLIYVSTERSWRSPTSCVWASAARIGRQFGISVPYNRLQHFFVGILSIQTPTTSTYVEQLRMLAEERPPNVHEIKTAIENINRLQPTNTDLDSIRHLRCLPVKIADGRAELASTASQFFVVDRIEYGTAFRDKVPIMDFSLEDIRRLRPFLDALELGDRYMSLAIEETTTVQQPASEPSTILTRAFRQKSKAFYR
jgi:hypothetical protein